MNNGNMAPKQEKFISPILILFGIWSFFVLAPHGRICAQTEKSTWAAAGFGKPKIETVDVQKLLRKGKEQFSYSHGLDLTLVVFRGTEWTKKLVLKRLIKVARTFARCGVKLRRVKLVIANAPGNTIDFLRPGLRDWEIVKLLPPTPKPVLFFIRSIPKYNAYAWVQSSGNEEIPAEVRNTAWFSLSVTMDLNKKIRHPEYVSEAHELGHLLLDSMEHPPKGTKNLMADYYEDVNDLLTPGQCEKIKSHPLVFTLEE